MKEPVTEVALDTAAGLVTVTAECEAGKCKTVKFNNVPAFVFELDFKVQVPGVGEVSVDIASGIIEIGARIKRAVEASYTPVHPDDPNIKGVSVLEYTQPIEIEDGVRVAVNTVVVSPGRFDRSPCGTRKCARLAVMHARGEVSGGEVFKHRNIIGTEFMCHIRGTFMVGDYKAVLPTVQGRGWITSFKQIVLDSTDPFP
ncbi:hypothetical protein BDV30DRAFT_235024 [Aspergillus minisclerotigenes]|uniref:Uncharacterized protein n=1 Tax=Aspergillus minisclerotigenes TaxID=656917 RepID=A0A5N6JEC5_9EURO|nr:hypothetical protein BDV30DRAFT_235024 [Aspergillus minisclerotigenes]